MKSTMLNVTVSTIARDAIHEAAERAGMSYSDFVRNAVLTACNQNGVMLTPEQLIRPVGRQVGYTRSKKGE
jgi:uncharacterized protein (DUF1778 family)